ncbi:hypothetical protein FACS1894217_11480 [Clostridia bacterium]|nr:hypothetical protein FACS1894217_11480 [Clostridia bacterium]
MELTYPNNPGGVLDFSRLAPKRERERCLLEQIYQAHRNTMFHIANNILKNDAMSENIVHDAFVAMLEQTESFPQDFDYDTRGLLNIIVKRKAINLAKREKIMFCDDTLEHNTPDTKGSVEDSVVNDDTYRRLVDLIRSLDEKYSSVLLLKYEHNFSARDMARYLGITEGTAQKRFQRAKQMLKTRMEREEIL